MTNASESHRRRIQKPALDECAGKNRRCGTHRCQTCSFAEERPQRRPSQEDEERSLSSRCRRLRREIVLVHIGEEPRLDRIPAEPLSRQCARRGIVESEKVPEPAEMLDGFRQ